MPSTFFSYKNITMKTKIKWSWKCVGKVLGRNTWKSVSVYSSFQLIKHILNICKKILGFGSTGYRIILCSLYFWWACGWAGRHSEKWKWKLVSRVQPFGSPWTVACQAPLSMGILWARILEWVAVPFSRGSSQSRDPTQVSHISGRFFTVWATKEAQEYWSG